MLLKAISVLSNEMGGYVSIGCEFQTSNRSSQTNLSITFAVQNFLTMEKAIQYINDNKQRFLDELFELLRIPSVSADPKYKDDVARCAESVASHLRNAGADKVEVCQTKGHPIVYGEKLIDPSKPTVLVYGHYDVQPADPFELWDTPPFEPTIRKTAIHPDGAIFARGSCDDKGQMFSHVKAFEAMMKTGTLPCNVKFMIEGEEECGSNNLGPFVKENK